MKVKKKMRIAPLAAALRAPSFAQNHFLHELFFTLLRPTAPQTGYFVLARAARRALRSHQVASRRSNAFSAAALLLASLSLAGCAKKHHSSAAPAVPRASTAEVVDGETGIASWYGHPYHGRPAANGEIYDMEKLTAAHRTLPFGTWVRVVNLSNDKTVDVRITDRGPFVENRIIDLSHAAGEAIALIGPGVARVRLDILSVPTTASGENWYAVQAGAFLDRDRAEHLLTSLERDFGPAHLVQRPDTPSLWRVVVGRVPSEAAAAALARRIRVQTGTAFVVRLDSSAPTPDATGGAR
jgi:rare lipoprotein A